jgi:hypothetical protein
MVHDGKDPNTYTKNDVESEFSKDVRKRGSKGYANVCTDGEFHVDLYTLPDNLVKQLWDFTAAKVDL